MSLQNIIQQIQQQVGSAHAKIRNVAENVQTENGLLRRELQRQQQDIANLDQALKSVKSIESTGGRSVDPSDIRYIENIPGRRVPFDMMVAIAIGANSTAEQQGTETVSQDGPFVAVARYATFQSAHQFAVTDTETNAVANFQGRSFGRFRPIHSAWDLNDAGAGVFQPIAGAAAPGTGAAIYASPSNHSSFRSMEFDGTVEFLNQGSGYHRQNIAVPTPFWSQQINSPFNLGALDFFSRGETLQWKVTPTHTNNPRAGNVTGFDAAGNFPFAGSQYDVHEGVLDPVQVAETTDPVARLPDGILYIGFHGFRIIQPPGPVAM